MHRLLHKNESDLSTPGFLLHIMGDSSLSASELRQRYHKGGSIPDNELSAQQVRTLLPVYTYSGITTSHHNTQAK